MSEQHQPVIDTVDHSRSTRAAGLGAGSYLGVISRNRALIQELVLRDLRGGHAGHSLGSVWIYLQPMVVVATYMLIFGVVIGTKINASANFPGDYTSYIVVGMVPWLVMANALGRAPYIFSSNANLVKQVVFPIEVLPVASVVSCFLIFVPSIVLMVVYKATVGGGLTWMVMLLPVIVCLHAIFALGLMLVLSVTTPFLRDIREFVTIYLSISMYFTPAIYLPDWAPAAVRPVLYLNPFSYLTWVYQDVLFFGSVHHPYAWVMLLLLSAGSFFGGVRVFKRIKPFLGNVL